MKKIDKTSVNYEDKGFLEAPLLITSYVDEDGMEHNIEDGILREDLDSNYVEQIGTNYISIIDGDTTPTHKSPRYYETHHEPEGSVSIKTPTKFSWGVIAAITAFCVNIAYNGITWYNNQANFNERVTEKLDIVNERLRDLHDRTYSKDEVDLRFERLLLDLRRGDLSTQTKLTSNHVPTGEKE